MLKPNFKIEEKSLEKNITELVIDPLPQNFGHTIGNALRRVLLSSLVGAAAVRVKIENINHQFSTMEGLQDDVLDFVLNLKQLRFVLESEGPVTVTLQAKGKGVVTGADLKLPSGVKLVNPEHVLAELTSASAKLNAEIEVSQGTGYVPAEQHANEEIGAIPLDASFSPIIAVNYKVEATRVGRKTDFDKVRLTVTTDGTIDAKDALEQASKVLSNFFAQVNNPKFEEPVEEELSPLVKIGDIQPVEDLDLPVRVINALKKGGFKYLSDLSGIVASDLTKVKNIGEKSAIDIVEQVEQKLK
jgi:DNA-directed RNA polymerase subunit alpha